MKYRLKIDDQVFDVEVENIFARPVIAVVDGVRFEVWPQEAEQPAQAEAPAQAPVRRAAPTQAASRAPVQPAAAPAGEAHGSQNLIKAPIPGVIVSIAVQPGAVVSEGQEICILEAMKMKNVIRSPQAGTVAAIRVQVGQQVKHQEPLVELM